MDIVVFGTGPFAVPTFEKLLTSNHNVTTVVTRPIADAGKRRKTAENPVRDLAEAKGLTVLDPPNVNDDAVVQQLSALNADLFFVCDYGQILSRQCLAAARLGGINLHGSLLPKYRGAAPIHWAIYNGESETGVTVIQMTPKLDGGPALSIAKTEIGAGDTTESLEPRLSEIGVTAVEEAIELLAGWNGTDEIGQKQNNKQATKAPRLKKADGKLDWNKPAIQLERQIRAFQPWPGSFTLFPSGKQGKQPLRVIVHGASVMQVETDAPAGVVVGADKKLLAVQTSEGALAIHEVQPAGKRPMPVEDFLRGKSIDIGQSLE